MTAGVLNHETTSPPGRKGYRRGCRCSECVAGWEQYDAAKKAIASSLRAARRSPAPAAVEVDPPVWSGPRLPVSPLLDALRGSRSSAALRLGVDRRQLYRWLAYGVSWGQADELAVRVGVHPSAVWGAAWWALTGP